MTRGNQVAQFMLSWPGGSRSASIASGLAQVRPWWPGGRSIFQQAAGGPANGILDLRCLVPFHSNAMTLRTASMIFAASGR